MIIYKQELLRHTGFREIFLPYSTPEEAISAILKVDTQDEIPCMWYQHRQENELTPFLLLAIGTGQDYEKLSRELYIGSAILHNDTLVLHFFLIGYPKENK